MMNSFVSVGLTAWLEIDSAGVPGNDGGSVDMAELGIGRVGSHVGGAIGSVMERRFKLREADEVDRDDRVSKASSPPGVGGGAMTSASGSRETLLLTDRDP
jgi:hypothetical protein